MAKPVMCCFRRFMLRSPRRGSEMHPLGTHSVMRMPNSSYRLCDTPLDDGPGRHLDGRRGSSTSDKTIGPLRTGLPRHPAAPGRDWYPTHPGAAPGRGPGSQLVERQLDAAVLRPTLGRVVGGHGLLTAEARGLDSVGGDAGLYEQALQCLSTFERQPLVSGRVARLICVTLDTQRRFREGSEKGAKLSDGRLRLRSRL